MENATRDENRIKTVLLENDDGTTGYWLADHATGYALVSVTPISAPTAIDNYSNDENRAHPTLLVDDSDGTPKPWIANSVGGAWITLT
jgi:hypothetical protein